jgi:copper resistance protein B
MEIAVLLLAGARLVPADAPPSGHVPPDPPAASMPDMPDAQMADAMQMHDDARFGMLKIDQLEHALGAGRAAYEGEAWYGSDFDKLWLRSEGEHERGRTHWRTEVFWDHAFASFWDSQLGARHDAGAGPTRDWLAFGVQGTAPYWIEVEATGYVGADGRSAARLRAEYELDFTQRLILQTEAELNAYGRSDPRREIGSGLSDAALGLRLRYEVRREFAPYVGVVRTQRFGSSADLARTLGHDAVDTQFVAGMRFWF